MSVGWRVGFAVGAIAALFVVWMRRSLPESPRWLLTKGRQAEAEANVQEIEVRAGQTTRERASAITVDGQPAQPFFSQCEN